MRRTVETMQVRRVLQTNSTDRADLAPPDATPTTDSLPRRIADFDTLGEALDYAARGRKGMNFHDARGSLVRAYPYSELREDSLANARRFVVLGIKPGDRVALVAETGADFAAAFFGAIYAGAWPVPLPLPTSFGGRQAYVDQLKIQLQSCDPVLFLVPSDLAEMAAEAAGSVPVRDWATLPGLDQSDSDLPASGPDEIAYLQ